MGEKVVADTTAAGKRTSVATSRAVGPRSLAVRLFSAGSLGLYFVALLLPCVFVRPGHAQEGLVNRENLIKAAYLANFLRYVDWPEEAEDANRPPMIAVVGRHPVVPYLQQAAQQSDETLFQVVVVDGETVSREYRILFLPGSLDPDLRRKLLQSARNFPVLTVGENLEFLQEGGEVRFVIEDNKLRLELALRAIESKKLKVSSKLLQVARVLDAEPRVSKSSR